MIKEVFCMNETIINWIIEVFENNIRIKGDYSERCEIEWDMEKIREDLREISI